MNRRLFSFFLYVIGSEWEALKRHWLCSNVSQSAKKIYFLLENQHEWLISEKIRFFRFLHSSVHASLINSHQDMLVMWNTAIDF